MTPRPLHAGPPRRTLLVALAAVPLLAAHGTAGVAVSQTPACIGDTLAIRQDTTISETTATIAPGIRYHCILDRRGPWAIHVVEVALRGAFRVDAERARSQFLGRERVSEMAARLGREGRTPLVGLNADFFDLGTGEIENNHVVRGEWVKGVPLTDSPHDTVDNAHAQFAMDERGRPYVGRFSLLATVTVGTRTEPLEGINYQPGTRPGLTLFTPWFGRATPGDSALLAPPPPNLRAGTPAARQDSARRAAARASRDAHEVVLTRIGRRGDTLLYRAQRGGSRPGGGHAIPRQGAILRGAGESGTSLVDSIGAAGMIVKVHVRTTGTRGALQTLVGGWGQVVDDGVNIGAATDSLEFTSRSFSKSRHPRSGVGISRDSTRLFLVAVDGRRPWSVGMTLEELGALMLRLGAWDAMNLDGGGSTALWVRGRLMNAPSDATGERAVGNALFVRPRR